MTEPVNRELLPISSRRPSSRVVYGSLTLRIGMVVDAVSIRDGASDASPSRALIDRAFGESSYKGHMVDALAVRRR